MKQLTCGCLLGLMLTLSPAWAQKAYGPGVSDTEIKIGNIMPYSGHASAWGVAGKAEAAFFQMINDQGGVNGRKIKFISYDDAYSPPKTVEQARKLVESDEVLLLFNPLGTAGNVAIRRYMNAKKVPHLFTGSGAHTFTDPKNYPWTMGFLPSYQVEGWIYAKYILERYPAAKIGILSQNDDLGKDYIKGFLEGLGDKLKPTLHVTYETSSPTIDSEIVRLKASGADVFFDVSSSKFAVQAIRKAAELNWKPVHILASVSASIGSVLAPAGFENAQGIISSAYAKDPGEAVWKDDPGYKRWAAFAEKYLPNADLTDSVYVYAHNLGSVLVHVLKQCGDDLTRENVMRQATSIKDLEMDMLLPGIRINTSPTDYAMIKQEQLRQFKGTGWERIGEVLSAADRSND